MDAEYASVVLAPVGAISAVLYLDGLGVAPVVVFQKTPEDALDDLNVECSNVLGLL